MVGNEGKANAGLVIGVSAAVASAIALLRSRTTQAAASGIVTLDDTTIKLLIAIAEQTGQIDDDLLTAINAIRNISVGGAGGGSYPPNADKIRSTRLQIGATGTPYQLDDIPVPDGMELLIKGWPGNVGVIYVGETSSSCINPNQVWPLIANEMVNYKVKNANCIWVSGTVVNDFVGITVEQRGK